MPEWKVGPPTEPGKYITTGKRFGDVVIYLNEGDIKLHQQESTITMHYGPIPDPPKPLPSVTKAFLARRTDGEKHDKAIGFYVASESAFYVTDNDGYQACCAPKPFYDHYEITEWLDGGDE